MGIITTNTVAGQIANFESDRAATIRSLKVYFSPKQSGTGDPSPENVRSISGWDGVTVQRAGKNLFSENGEFGKWTDSSGVINNAMSGFIGEIMTISPDQMLSVGYWGIRPYSFSIIELNKDKEFIKRTHKATSPTSSSPPDKLSTVTTQDTKYVYVQVYAPNTSTVMTSDVLASEKITVELGNSLTAYESFNGSSFTATFPSTQYGGYVDLISGEVWKTHSLLHFIPSYIQAVIEGIYSPYYAVSATIGNAVVQNNIVSDKLVGNSNPNEFEAFISSEPRLIVGLPSTLNTLSAVRSWMEDIGGFDVVYKLATPQLVTTLSPTAITTLIGTNNFWSNADSVEVTYDVYLPDSIEQHRRRVLLETPHREYAIDNFNTDMRSYLKECRAYFSPVQEDGIVSPTSPKAISGWDGVTVYSGGKNLAKVSSTNRYEYRSTYGYFTQSDGIVTITGNSTGGYLIPCKSNTTYTYSFRTTAYGMQLSMRIWIFDSNSVEFTQDTLFLTTITTGEYNTVTFTTPSDAHYMLFGFYAYSTLAANGITISNIQVEFGDTATEYEEYREQDVYEVEFPDNQTIYGGYVDLVNGEIVKEWEYYDAKNINWSATSQVSRGVFLGNIPPRDQSISDGNIICDSYKTADHNTSITVVDDLTIKGHANTSYPSNLYIRDQRYTTVEDFKANLNAHFVYKLATPIHYPITPEQIRPIKGNNNFWSDANGRIEVVYYKRRSDGIRPIDGYAYVTSDGYLIATDDSAYIFGEEAI